MLNIHEVIGITAGVLSLVGYIPYIWSIFAGRTRPNKATWIIWTVIGGLLALSYFIEGEAQAIWQPIGYFIGPLIVAVLAFRFGYSEWTKLDIFCLIAAALSLIPWIFANDAILTLIINVFIDSTGAIPTLVKTYKEPDTEDLIAWIIFFIANTLQLLALTQLNFSIIYPIYLFFLAGGMVALILKGKLTCPKSPPLQKKD